MYRSLARLFLPLECQIQEHEEDTESVSNPVGCTGVFSRHGSQARSSDDDTDKASDVHAPSGVDLVVEPGSERVVNDTCICQLHPRPIRTVSSYQQWSAKRRSATGALTLSCQGWYTGEQHSCSIPVSD